MMSFPFFRIMKNTIYSDTSLDKTLNIVYNVFARRSSGASRRGMVFLTLTWRGRICAYRARTSIKIQERKEKMKLIKRNGSEVIFDREKIYLAVKKANEAVDEKYRITDEDIENIALEVERLCLTMVRSPGVEEIQDLVEKEIMKLG